MLHGRLTPLGTQLRQVLAHLSPRRRSTSALYQPCIPQCHPRRLQHGSGIGIPSAIQPAIPTSNPPDIHEEDRLPAQGSASTPPSKRLRNVDFDGRHHVEPTAEEASLAPAFLLHASEYSDQRAYKHRNARMSALERIFRDFVKSSKADRDSLAAEWEVSYKPTPHALEVLLAARYNVTHLVAWAQIENESDSFAAAAKLEALLKSSTTTPIPLFLYMGIVDRLYVSAKALRVLLRLAYVLFDPSDARPLLHGLRDDSVFIAGAGLLRHAREVWPSSLTAIVELVVNHYRKLELDEDALPTATRKLNKLLKLVSMSTAENPFRDNHHQEAAMLPILQFMAEHSPSMQINREGYRAVIRIQLAQRKTHEDQQWAELKSHAWPPWKVDRTAMDEFIDVENYGQSKAARTLARMREAGYAPEEWERNAQIFAGWDVDGTPTIQTRTTRDSRTSAWAARIETTRTVQEAWACYLAWEEWALPHDQDIYLATAEKLREEERRSHKEEVKEDRNDHGKAWPVLPGDVREVAPLPKSTHLWTYTRTKPPSMHSFYSHICARGAVLGKHVLAFFVSHAGTPESGLQYLRDHVSQCPEIEGILNLRSTHDLTRISDPIYKAAITLYSRMGFVPSGKLLKGRGQEIPETGLKADYEIGIVSAIELLRRRKDPHRAWYHVVLQGLTREDNLQQMSKLNVDEKNAVANHDAPLSSDLLQCHGAVIAYQLALKVLDWQRDHHIDPDSGTFYSFCRAVENFAVAVWIAVENGQLIGNLHDRRYFNIRLLLQDSPNERQRRHPKIACQEEFLRLVSPLQDEGDTLAVPGLPRLLTTPSPYALHAYVRALGWLGYYDGLLDLTQFMRQHGDELAIRKSQDRGGEMAMRRTIVALRVFLERSWLPNDRPKEEADVSKPPPLDAATYAPLEADSRAPLPTSEPEPEPYKLSIRYQVHADRALKLLAQFRASASEEIVTAVREVVEDVGEWGGWPDEKEVEIYCQDKKFTSSPFRK
ncbi:uncharacterized protein MYCFIDRAFT_89319 [Pseudocercospora fijiensis CIRAD86]|uniref:Uncharacterized protein n=1 Tax=Pseudocercospora fijiensis (strain CIRAD86) TaxID=383855 RepID=M2ZGF3_PSEFD|nr:uncharacterized protein MYCFIDRAFT_89319 [Pseudocercospora fijiensis CIRAD86]EME78199.1 hypothetical protein MYCFIDRAFT_89319 [Pseudocercospora fijiensis CIRAD86]